MNKINNNNRSICNKKMINSSKLQVKDFKLNTKL